MEETQEGLPRPFNSAVSALLTDLYQLTMTYAYWKHGRHNEASIFELFFRKNPFPGGTYTIFCGLDECLKHLQHFQFSDSDIAYLQSVPALQHCEDEFWKWLAQPNLLESVTVTALLDGTVAFPRVPLLTVSGPLAACQLLETTLLTLVNYPSLVATNASRMVRVAQAVDPNQQRIPVCVEFGLRRAQGPDGAMSASKYCTVGGFVGTSNVQAGKAFGLTISGTHAHAYVQSYTSLQQVQEVTIYNKKTGETIAFLPLVLQMRQQLAGTMEHAAYEKTHEGELAAFVAYATAFSHSFLALIDTYDTLASGVLNFMTVALALDECGYQAIGVRLDSGDLGTLSLECRKCFLQTAETMNRPCLKELQIVASNDINETTLQKLNNKGHAITIYGIGTNLVTCQAQPALGCVYKLVEIAGQPRIKLSQDLEKVLVPGKKKVFRLYLQDATVAMDVLLAQDEDDPVAGQRFVCRHPFLEQARVAITPARVEALPVLVFADGKVVADTSRRNRRPTVNRTLEEAAAAVKQQLAAIQPDQYNNDDAKKNEYKVYVSQKLYDKLHQLWEREAPMKELL